MNYPHACINFDSKAFGACRKLFRPEEMTKLQDIMKIKMVETILRTHNLTFQHSAETTPLSFADILIKPSQHSLVLGDSGTGKTTLLHLLGGLSHPTGGTVHLCDQNLYALSDSALDRFRAQNVGFIFQEAHLLPNLSIMENIQLAQHLAKRKQDNERIWSILEKLQLAEQAKKLPHQVSRGQLQRAAIARAIVNEPQLLLADEPTASLDDNNTERVLELLLDTADVYRSTLVIATHDKRIKDHFSNTYNLQV